MSWLEDLYEETIVELSGERVTPLVTNPGRIMLTSSRIYFQPYNNVEVVRGKLSMYIHTVMSDSCITLGTSTQATVVRLEVCYKEKIHVETCGM